MDGVTMSCKSVALCGALAIPAAMAQAPAVPIEFPQEAKPMTAQALKERLAGKVFKARPAGGGWFRLEYRANGQYFLNTDRGFNSTGTWRVDGSILCTDRPGAPESCGETRAAGDTLYVKRSTAPGEVLKLESD